MFVATCFSESNPTYCDTSKIDNFASNLLEIETDEFNMWRRKNNKLDISCAAYKEYELRRERQWKILKSMIIVTGAAGGVALLGVMSTDGGEEPIFPFGVIYGAGIIALVNSGTCMLIYTRIGRKLSESECRLKHEYQITNTKNNTKIKNCIEFGISTTF